MVDTPLPVRQFMAGSDLTNNAFAPQGSWPMGSTQKEHLIMNHDDNRISNHEREIIQNIIDFSFIIKAQLHSGNTMLLRSLLNVLIIEAEDLLEDLDELDCASEARPSSSARD